MAKYCGKCGSKLDEFTGLCPNCDAGKSAKQADKIKSEETPKQESALGEEKLLSKKKAKNQCLADKKIAKKAKKATKKELWASMTSGQKLKKISIRLLLWILLLCVVVTGILGSLVHLNLIDIPVTSDSTGRSDTGDDTLDTDPFKHLGAGFTDTLVSDEKSAMSVAKEAAQILGLENIADELTVSSVNNVDGVTYYRLQQNCNNVPFIGKTMVVIANKQGRVLGFTTNAVTVSNLDFGSGISSKTVKDELTTYLTEDGYDFANDDFQIENCSEENRAYYESDEGIIPVYVLDIFHGNSPLSFMTVTVNALTGKIVGISSSINEGESIVYNSDRSVSVNGYYDDEKNEYQLYDPMRGIFIFSYENTDSKSGNETQTFLTSANELFGDTKEERNLEQGKGIVLMSNISGIHDYYKKIMGWDGYGKTYCFYNDGFYSGKNALGGAASISAGETVGYLSMGSVTGVDALDIMAHEYTHVVSRKIVSWQEVKEWGSQPYEYGAIDEGYSDIFGEILEGYLKKSEPDWIHGDRDIQNPKSKNYPAAVGDKKLKKIDNSNWGMETGFLTYTDYSHGFSTIISHCAYLMNHGVNNTCDAIDINSLAKLWYNTLLTLPSNCTFVVLRENMELTADILGFSESQKNCISSAFDKVKILRQEEGEETYSTASNLLVLDKNGNAYSDCSVVISGKKFTGLFKTGLWKEDYSQEVTITDSTAVALNLPKGDYVITVTDNIDKTQETQKHIKARPDGKLSEIIIATDFGGESVVQVPQRTTSDEIDIVLVLDASGSMSGTPLSETKKASAKFIENILNEDASIGIVTYDNSVSMLSDFSMNRDTLSSAVSSIYSGGGTNIEAGLAEAYSMLNISNAKKKIIVLMSDGEPNDGKEGDALISYADEIKNDGIMIYTLGFFESLGNYKSSAQILMEGIASDGCHYEVADADDLVFFFGDMADQINGQKYIYIRIACPVDVTVTYHGETLCSAEDDLNVRTDFGTLTFEDHEASANGDDRIKVLRLKEGTEYDVRIVGTGYGLMDYTIGFMDENGDYSDFRRFVNVKITRNTEIDTVAAVSKESILNVDEDGDGKYDLKLRAKENGYGEEVKESILIYVVVVGGVVLLSLIAFLMIRRKRKARASANTIHATKFCGNCGTKLEDTAKVCGSCGTPWRDISIGNRGLKISDSEKRKKVKKTIWIIGILVALVVVGIIVLNVVSMFTGYNGLLRKVMTAYETYDIDTLVSVSSDMYYYGEEDLAEHYFKENINEDFDFFDSAVGHSYKLSYKVNETYTLSEYKLDKLLHEIENTYSDFDINSIEEIVIADLTVTAKQGSKSVNSNMNVVMSKEDGNWRLLYIE